MLIIHKGDIITDENYKIKARDKVYFVCEKCGKNTKKLGQYFNYNLLCKECLREKTNLKKYGYKTSTENKNVLKKRRKKRIEKSLIVLNKRLKNNNVELIENYSGVRVGNRSELGNIKKYYNFKCLNCGNVFVDHLYGKRIPVCRVCYPYAISIGESKIYNSLKHLNIYFIQQKTFENCKDKNLLPFDFYLPDYNTLIEYDGVQHFKAIKHFGGIKKLETQQLHDNIKTNFCIDNNIKLIRIKYSDEINEKIKGIKC